MESDTVHDIFKHVCELVVSTGEYVRSATDTRRTTTSKECFADLVTEYDQNTEKMLVTALTSQYPTHKFIAEEMTADGAACNLTDSPTWIIDPIDGTTNFVHGFPRFCISIGYYVKKEAVFGIVYDIPNDKMFSAIKGEGAFCNGRVLRCSSVTELGKSLIGGEFGSQRDPEFLKFKIDMMARVVEKCHGIRCLGSAALQICSVAAGQLDAYLEYGPHIWDFAAAHLIAQEAGAICSSPSGGPLDICSRKILVTSTRDLRDQIVPLAGDFDLPRD